VREYELKVFGGRSNTALFAEIVKVLGVQPGMIEIEDFSDGETFVRIEENIRGADVFAVQSICHPGNANLMEMLIMMDAFRRSSAERITAVIPYFGYARQDRKTGSRTPISAKLVANLITEAGASRVLTMELHADQIQGFFDIPTDNLIVSPVFVPDIEKKFDGESLCIVSPDVGGVVRARALAKRLGADLAIIHKRREKAGVSEVMNVIGNIEGKVCIIVDDMIDSGGTLCNAAVALKENGAKEVHAYIVHGVLSGGAVARVTASPLKSLVITDSISETEAVRRAHNIERLSIAPLMGEAIRRISKEESISALFK